MSKHWKQPGRKSIAAYPSRIRREPVRVPTAAELQEAADRNREREKWRAAAGVLLFGAGIAALTIGVGAATFSRYDPVAAARDAARFRQCYNGGINCVLDGDTIFFERQQLQIAGIDTPRIQGASCGEEKVRGIDSAVRLAELLNSGRVTVSDPFRDPYGRVVRTVQVNGKDVAKAMISARVARPYNGEELSRRASACPKIPK